MRKNPYYIVKMVGDEYYLIPFGQAIENHAYTIHISEVAAFIWDELDVYQEENALAERLAEEYEIMPEDAESVEEDVRELLRDFRQEGVVLEDGEGVIDPNMGASNFTRKRSLAETDMGVLPVHIMRIADITIRFFGNEKYFHSDFVPFCVNAEEWRGFKGNGKGGEMAQNDISVYVTEEEPPKSEGIPRILRGMSVGLYDGGECYVMKSIEMPEMREGHFWKDGSKAVLYMDPEAKVPEFFKQIRFEQLKESVQKKGWNSPEDVKVDFAECVFHAIRHAFMLKAQCLGMYVIHSASIMYDGRAWLFSALSGTGKSTHTNIWHKLYNTPFLDGDLNLLAFENGSPVVKGIPWCGTSGIFTTETHPLGGIILLARDKINYVEELSYQEQVLGIQMRFISPKWNARQVSDSIAFAERIAKSARIARLYCNMEDEAAMVCRAWIDSCR